MAGDGLTHLNNAGGIMGCYNWLMSKIDFEKAKHRSRDKLQIGADDDAQIPFGAILRRMRATLQRDKPGLTPVEIERRLRRMTSRGMRPAKPFC